MKNIRFINSNNDNDYFDIPWEWISSKGVEPNVDDLESEANRGKLTALLYRVRAGEIPNMKISVIKKLTQAQLYPLLKITRPTKLKMYYFEKYDNAYKTIDVYVKKINPPVFRYPQDDNTDNIIYDHFDIEITAYGSIS